MRWTTGSDACRRVEAIGIIAIPAGEPFEHLCAELFRRYPATRDLVPEALPDHVFPRLFGEIAAR